MALPYNRNEVKDRARETWHGMCNVIMPSFTSDFTGLNREGIAHDVRRSAELGFWGTLVVSEAGTSFEQYVEFMEIAADAAPDEFRLVAHLSFSTHEESVRAADVAENLGYEAALPAYPPNLTFTSSKEIVDYTHDLASATDLALILFGVETWSFRDIHPAGFPPDALEEMARIETAAAIKYEANSPGMVAGMADLLRRCGELVLIQNPMEQNAPGMIEWFGMQWMGTSNYEMYGDRVPRWFQMIHDGKWDEGMELYWSYQDLREAKGAFHKTFSGANLIHRNGWKYLQWLQGFNGGLLPMPQMRLQGSQMRRFRKAAAASGFEVPDSDDGFIEGRFPA